MKVSSASSTQFLHEQTDIRFLVPMNPGDRICLFNGTPSLRLGLTDGGSIEVLSAEDVRSILPTESMDHVIIVSAGNDFISTVKEASRMLKAGGTLLVGTRRAQRRSIQRTLERIGFEILNVCGVRDSLRNPHYFIPLENPAATRFFFEQMHSPVSLRAEVLRRFAKAITAIGLHSYLYREFTILARKV